ncbi:unnamed protein product [Brassica oleracea]|uniref:PPM-type phosphatase domain-containing protein n=1 Tax=Brassica oleracea TaxID=3712 RepID=A0A3P6DI38_BRAOL|nr:unnamed protein product [Brassica oleracea]
MCGSSQEGSVAVDMRSCDGNLWDKNLFASDGLWDVFSNEEAVAVVKEVEDPEESTKKLTANIKASGISSTHSSSSQKEIKGKPQLELTLTTVHNSLDRTVDNQKAVEAKAIAAAHTTSSEQSGSIGEKNQNSTPVHSDSTTSKASSVPFISLSKMSTLTSK